MHRYMNTSYKPKLESLTLEIFHKWSFDLAQKFAVATPPRCTANVAGSTVKVLWSNDFIPQNIM